MIKNMLDKDPKKAQEILVRCLEFVKLGEKTGLPLFVRLIPESPIDIHPSFYKLDYLPISGLNIDDVIYGVQLLMQNGDVYCGTDGIYHVSRGLNE